MDLEENQTKKKKSLMQWMLVLLSCLALCIGTTAGPLSLRFYFIHGGSSRWLCSWLETAGWPILILPLLILYKRQPDVQHVTPQQCLAFCAIGLITGVDDYMDAWGVSYLPLSTYALLNTTQLAFNAIFAYLLVRQRFSPYSINAIILLTLGSVLLAFQSKSDRPKGHSNKNYILGFLLTIGAAGLYGLVLPVIELVYKRSKRRVTYTLVMEMQLIMSFSATVLCTIGMVVNKDFETVASEARASDVGEVKFYTALVWNAISWQLFFIGVFGVIFLTSSLLSGILKTVFIPVTQVLAVIIYHENFSGEKGLALALALWGFASFLYGEYLKSKQPANVTELNDQHIPGHNCECSGIKEERALEMEFEENSTNAETPELGDAFKVDL
ncbi:purine permease 3-like [Cryptomeria japonica]|uniref:purine permease 3-like n=1 Tax=Cryptomeria japonica TaxID=3369 RepID=UPI0025AD8BA5|nr:purine permease 3-like [Cryptomeria japonica]